MILRNASEHKRVEILTARLHVSSEIVLNFSEITFVFSFFDELANLMLCFIKEKHSIGIF